MRLLLNNDCGHRIADVNLEYLKAHTDLDPQAGPVDNVAAVIERLDRVVYVREGISDEWWRVQELSTLLWYMQREDGFCKDMSWSFAEGTAAIGF